MMNQRVVSLSDCDCSFSEDVNNVAAVLTCRQLYLHYSKAKLYTENVCSTIAVLRVKKSEMCEMVVNK